MDEMFQAATMAVAFLICLGILYGPCQAYHKLFHNSFNSARIITLLVFIATSILFFQMCQMHNRLFWDGLDALEFPWGEKLVALDLGEVSVACVLGPQVNSMESSFLASQVALR